MAVRRHLGLTCYGTRGLLERIWELRGNLSTCDAGYVALAESLDRPLVTADARILGPRCRMTVMPGSR